MARLEHAKLMAKIQKKQEEKRVIKVTFLPLSTFKHATYNCTVARYRQGIGLKTNFKSRVSRMGG